MCGSAGKMDHWEKALVAETNDLNSVPRKNMVEREDQLPQVFLFNPHVNHGILCYPT